MSIGGVKHATTLSVKDRDELSKNFLIVYPFLYLSQHSKLLDPQNS